MPAAELAVWLVPGYLTLLLYLHVNPLRSKQSYEWFFQAAGFGILSYLVAWAMEAAWRHTFGMLPPLAPAFDAAFISAWWDGHFGFARSNLWPIAVLTTPVGAMIATWGRRLLFTPSQHLLARLSPGERSSDILLSRCTQLEEKPVIVTLDGGKVYVGVLTDFTTDPDEADRYIEIVAIMSGYRNAESGFVKFTTPYIARSAMPQEGALEDLAARRAILIPVRKITTFAPFDSELHEWFKTNALVEVAFETAQQEPNQP